ncbi:hypothetical protein SKAU_G00245580 [Synaphobranchus kaupii]|uniref:Uncharacterized protein n=1 Tax=Synaphobranchus kaupii TaxID=118154 RepID=A0A9Q1F1T1_SYNKA|nr:hypothetical protein SKAU_G00245580 [Synaphobranchus kaupii]
MDWEGAKVIRSESNRYHRWIKEAIEIRKQAQGTVNRDGILLPRTWDAVLLKLPGNIILSLVRLELSQLELGGQGGSFGLLLTLFGSGLVFSVDGVVRGFF